MNSPNDTNGGVRISNAKIYELLVETMGEVRSVKQTVNESLVPQVKDNTKNIQIRVEREVFEAHVRRTAAFELRMWAAIIGVLMALGGLNISGIV